MKKDQKGAAAAKPKKSNKPSPALNKARKDLAKEQDKTKKARKSASESRAELRRIRGGRLLRLLFGNAGGLVAGGIVEGINGTDLAAPGELLDNDIKRCVVPAAVGAGVALLAGDLIGPENADAVAIGMTAPLAYELAREGVRKLREPE